MKMAVPIGTMIANISKYTGGAAVLFLGGGATGEFGFATFLVIEEAWESGECGRLDGSRR